MAMTSRRSLPPKLLSFAVSVAKSAAALPSVVSVNQTQSWTLSVRWRSSSACCTALVVPPRAATSSVICIARRSGLAPRTPEASTAISRSAPASAPAACAACVRCACAARTHAHRTHAAHAAGALAGALLLIAVLASGVLGASPERLAMQITDDVAALGGTTSAVQQALDDLQRTDNVQLWVWFTDTTDGSAAADFATETAKLSSFGGNDLLLVIAMTDHAYGYWKSNSIPLSNAQLD